MLIDGPQFIGTRLSPPSVPPFCHPFGVIFTSFSFFFSPLPSPLFSTSPLPFLPYLPPFPPFPSPPYSSFSPSHLFPPSTPVSPLFSSPFLLFSASFGTPLHPSCFARFISGPAEALSDRIRAALSNGVIAADQRAHMLPSTLGVHWYSDLIFPAFFSIVVGRPLEGFMETSMLLFFSPSFLKPYSNFLQLSVWSRGPASFFLWVLSHW